MKAVIDKLSRFPNAKQVSIFNTSKTLVIDKTDKDVFIIYYNNQPYVLGNIIPTITLGTTVEKIFGSSNALITFDDTYNVIDLTDKYITTGRIRQKANAHSYFVGEVYNDSSSALLGFSEEFWFNENVSFSGLAPIGIGNIDAFYIVASGGSKFYLRDSFVIQESPAHKIIVGVPDTDIKSHNTWTQSTLRVTTVEDTIGEIKTASANVGNLSALPAESTYQVYNYTDDSSFFMGSGSIILNNHGGGDQTKIEMTDDKITLISSGSGGDTISMVFDHSATPKLTISGDFKFVGDLEIDGTLTVQSGTFLNDTLDVQSGKVEVDATGKLITTGGDELA